MWLCVRETLYTFSALCTSHLCLRVKVKLSRYGPEQALGEPVG